jgi:pimeloyl-ACP methyl ester carboxylesterase
MGGIAITQAAENCPKRICALVYLCAFLPGNGDSLMTWASRDRESLVNPSSTFPAGDGVIGFKPQYTHDAFYGNCSDEDQAFAKSRLVAQSLSPFVVPVNTTMERWGRIPRFYIECAYDRAITLELQHTMQRQSPCQHTFSIDTDHSPFFSAPEHLADILAHIATL